MEAEIARIDTDDSSNEAPKAWQVTGSDNEYFKNLLNEQPSETRLSICKKMMCQNIGLLDYVSSRDLTEYVDRVISTFDTDRLNDFMQSPFPYVKQIRNKVSTLVDEHRARTFERWRVQGKIVCQPNYTFPKSISPTKYISNLPKTLYESEEEMKPFERRMIWRVLGLENILWWHRNISQRGFCVNAAIYAYPDFILMTKSGNILMMETKGPQLDNPDSEIKARYGNEWASLAGSQYKYFMVYENKAPNYPGAYSREEFLEIIRDI
jgi:type III restriction enzyme